MGGTDARLNFNTLVPFMTSQRGHFVQAAETYCHEKTLKSAGPQKNTRTFPLKVTSHNTQEEP